MARESYRSSSNTFMRGPKSTAIPPSLNRQNSQPARQEPSTSPSGDATSLLFKVASTSASFRTSPRSSPPASPRQSPVLERDIQWDVVRRRLSETRKEGQYVSFPPFESQTGHESHEESSNSDSFSTHG